MIFCHFLGKGEAGSNVGVGVRILSGLSSGGMAVCIAQPTDVVKVRMQAQQPGQPVKYTSTFRAYTTIWTTEGLAGLWKGRGRKSPYMTFYPTSVYRQTTRVCVLMHHFETTKKQRNIKAKANLQTTKSFMMTNLLLILAAIDICYVVLQKKANRNQRSTFIFKYRYIISYEGL